MGPTGCAHDGGAPGIKYANICTNRGGTGRVGLRRSEQPSFAATSGDCALDQEQDPVRDEQRRRAGAMGEKSTRGQSLAGGVADAAFDSGLAVTNAAMGQDGNSG